MQEIKVQSQRTPNPRSVKFIVNKSVMNKGRATFTSLDQCGDISMAREILKLPEVTQVYFFDNVVTVTQEAEDWDTLLSMIKGIIEDQMPSHNSGFNPEEEKLKIRATLPENIQQIEAVLDRTVRPGLKSDGGNIEVIRLDGNELFVRYEGACGGCPSSTQGTLMAIEGILQNEVNPEIIVTPVE